MRRSSLQTVTMINLAFTSFIIHIEQMQTIVKVDTARTQVPTQQGGMRGKNGGHFNLSVFQQQQSNGSHPFMKMSNDCLFFTAMNKLQDATRGMKPDVDDTSK